MAATAISSSRTHAGQGPRRTIWPLAKTVRGYLKRNWNMKGTGGEAHRSPASVRLVGHAVHDVIDADAERHRGERLRVIRAVSPFPRVTQVHVVTDRHHHAPFVVADGAPLVNVSVFFVRPPRGH